MEMRLLHSTLQGQNLLAHAKIWKDIITLLDLRSSFHFLIYPGGEYIQEFAKMSITDNLLKMFYGKPWSLCVKFIAIFSLVNLNQFFFIVK